MKKTKYPVMNMGTVSILTIFILLCMVTFAALTCISARKDAAFAEQLADRTTAYYSAVSEASRRIGELDASFREAWENGSWEDLEDRVSFSVPVEEGRELQVTLEPCQPDGEGENGAFFHLVSNFDIDT